MMKWINRLMGIPVEDNPVDRAIVERLPGTENDTVQEVYKARWVWYHTILAIEIAFTNVLLLLILAVLAFK